LVLSLFANAYLGYSTLALQASNKKVELRLKQYENEPRLVQEYMVMPGNSFKAFTGINWTKATIDNMAHPEFVETPLGNEIYSFIDAEKSIRPLKSVQITFITLRNDGKSLAQDVKLITERGDQTLLLGNISPGTVKLIPIHFVRTQPIIEKSESRRFIKCMYTAASADGAVQHEVAVTPRSEASWIPSLDSVRGVGRALVSSDNEYLLR